MRLPVKGLRDLLADYDARVHTTGYQHLFAWKEQHGTYDL